MHIVDSTTSSGAATTSGSPEESGGGGGGGIGIGGGVRRRFGRPWEFYSADTEDSGVDSVSSIVDDAGGRCANGVGSVVVGGGVEYADVIVNRASEKQALEQRNSFLHTVYGGVKTAAEQLDCNANPSSPARRTTSKTASSNKTPVKIGETAKNSFLHSLLEDNAKNGESPAGSGQSTPKLEASSSASMALDLLPELVQLLDAKGMMNGGGLIELVGRDGTRASVRVTLAPPASGSERGPTTGGTVGTVGVARKSSFTSRLHRNSKRASQRRRLVEPAASAESKSSGSQMAAVAGGGAGSGLQQRPRSVRRRPSSAHHNNKKVAAAAAAAAATSVAPSKVAALTSKFNSIINESRRSEKPARRSGKSTGPAPSTTAAWSWRLLATSSANSSNAQSASTKRNSIASSAKPSVDTIPEVNDGEETADYGKLRRKSQDLAAKQTASDHKASQHSVYGTVKSIVKQAIKKFEKPEQNEASSCCEYADVATRNDHKAYDVKIPEGIQPNTSFLWRDRNAMQNLIYEATSFNERAAQQSNKSADNYYEMGSGKYDTLRSRQSNAYDTLHHPASKSSSRSSSSSSSSSGYDEIQPPAGNGRSKSSSVRYDDVKPGSANAVTYDELTFPDRRQCNAYDDLPRALSTTSSGGYIDPGSSSALGYERILPPDGKRSTNGDEDAATLQYEECASPGGPRSITMVKAVPALVCEDQLDSISYFYDDIRHGVGALASYGGSNHSYEPIYAHLGEANSSSSNKAGSSQAKSPYHSVEALSESSEEGTHAVYSYQLTQLGGPSGSSAVPDSPAPSVAGTSTSTRMGNERRSETSDDWCDVSEDDEPPANITIVRSRLDPSTQSFIRASHRSHRASRRKMSIPKSSQQSWSQTMRNLVRKRFLKATTTTTATKTAPGSVANEAAKPGNETGKGARKTFAKRLPSAETEASGTGSSQTWEDFGESDGDEQGPDHHYEALYEVINPLVQKSTSTTTTAAAAPSRMQNVVDPHEDSFEDSFEEDDPFEEDVARGPDTTSDTSRERPRSRSGSERSKESEDPMRQLGIARFADIAGAQMRRLRRNWSSTKTDISRSITRIKKKSAPGDLGDALKLSPPPPPLPNEKLGEQLPPALNGEKKKGTWALRQIRRRMTVAPQHAVRKKDSSTFYLTLTIEEVKQSKKAESKSLSPTSSPEPLTSTPSPVPPLVSASAADRAPIRPQRTSSASSLSSTSQTGRSRPKTAPPEPPVKAPGVNKKPVTRLAPSFSESQLVADRPIIDEYGPTQYSRIAIGATGRRSSQDGANSSTIYSKLSLSSTVSQNSSNTYLSVGDLASAPPRRRSGIAEDPRSYLSLHSPSESEELYMSSHFADEPLYQFYTAAIIERAAHNQGEGSEEDDYEVIGERAREDQAVSESSDKLPTAMELAAPSGGRRTLWCELPQVIKSGLLETISPQKRKLQEAMFELITSEASYLRSLNVLTTHFIQSREFAGELSPNGDPPLLTRLERHALFSDILPVRECSEALLADLERRWQQSIYIREICDILLEHASKNFEVYIKYCTNQLYQERTLRELKDKKPEFVEALRRLEASPVCQSLAMHSFLMLPMQRITRLPLLVDAIFHRLDSGTPEYERCRLTLATVNKIVQECNEGARKAERIHEMLVVSNQLDFAEVKGISIMSASRWLVKKGEMQRLMWRDIDARLTFGRKIHKQTVYIFLFTDLLVITKKKGEDSFAVLDYCPRNMVQVEEHFRVEKFTGKPGTELGKNLILLTMLQNHENKTVEMILSCSSESDRTRWLEAVTPRTSDNPEEKIYEEWDCPQVQAIHPYTATQPDELSLEVADVVNVLRKVADGWYQGVRLRDDQRGWFPGNYTVEIASTHVRARNLRQRYRLLALSGSFIEEQAKKDKEESKRKSKKLSLTGE